MHSPEYRWAAGTAYDFFASLYVIHHAESTGLRKAWAAGVRNRLLPAHRDLLGLLVSGISIPIQWITSLGEFPRSEDLAGALAALSDEAVLTTLLDCETLNHAVAARVLSRQICSDADAREFFNDPGSKALELGDVAAARRFLQVLASAPESGALLRDALNEYRQRFFQEEERRIEPHVRAALSTARELAGRLSFLDLVEELSGGLRLEDIGSAPSVVFVPAFWAGPLTIFQMIEEGGWAVLFSARPRDVSLIPGDPVPDNLVRSLQAVSDQTRLRILKLLVGAPRTQVEIARELRLRPPTITHHLRVLRLANLVRMTETLTGEKRYDVRLPRLDEIGNDLRGFVVPGS